MTPNPRRQGPEPSSAYRIPDDGRLRAVQFSGGRSSAFLLRNLLYHQDLALPETVRVVFCNTGKELPQTLDFVHECETRWKIPVTWLEFTYREDAGGGPSDPKYHYNIVDYRTADRVGTPFDELNRSRGLLPNALTRSCTSELKVRTTARFAKRHLGWAPKAACNLIGFRYDEPARWEKAILPHPPLRHTARHRPGLQLLLYRLKPRFSPQPKKAGIQETLRGAAKPGNPQEH